VQLLPVEIAGESMPTADVGVIDADPGAARRHVDRAYLLADVVSDADDAPEVVRRSIAPRRELYRTLGHCQAVAFVRADRMEIELDLRTTRAGRIPRLAAPARPC
jgi:hypothetical protein